MTSTKNRVFDSLPLSTCVHVGRIPSPLVDVTRGRHEIGLHTALLKRLVQWHAGLKLKFEYMIIIYLKLYY